MKNALILLILGLSSAHAETEAVTCPMPVQTVFENADTYDLRSDAQKFLIESSRILKAKGYRLQKQSKHQIQLDLHWAPWEGSLSTYGDRWTAKVSLDGLATATGTSVFWNVVSDGKTSRDLYAKMHGDGFYPVDAAILRALQNLKPCSELRR